MYNQKDKTSKFQLHTISKITHIHQSFSLHLYSTDFALRAYVEPK